MTFEEWFRQKRIQKLIGLAIASSQDTLEPEFYQCWQAAQKEKTSPFFIQEAIKNAKLEGRLEAIAEHEKEDKNWYKQGRKELAKEINDLVAVYAGRTGWEFQIALSKWLEKEVNKI